MQAQSLDKELFVNFISQPLPSRRAVDLRHSCRRDIRVKARNLGKLFKETDRARSMPATEALAPTATARKIWDRNTYQDPISCLNKGFERRGTRGPGNCWSFTHMSADSLFHQRLPCPA